MTRIVFASCMSVEADSKQPVWKEAAAHQPDWLILCGDNIYMDYFPHLYQSKKWDPVRFAAEMHVRYARQFAVPAFQALVKSIPANQVLGVWDDHDFAWNNCFGADPGFGMPIKKRIATAMYHHYFAVLNQRPLPPVLPDLIIPDPDNPPSGDRDVYLATTIGPLRVLLCDGRSYREDNSSGNETASLLGVAQERWLLDELARSSGPILLITGSTMTKGDDQSWDSYQEFFMKRFLPAVRGKTVMFLAGDVHENRLPPKTHDWPVEIVSSAAVLDFPFNKRNFGVLEIADAEAEIFLYKRGAIEYTGKIDFGSGLFKTTMSALAEDNISTLSIEHAQIQRRNEPQERNPQGLPFRARGELDLR